MSTYYDEFAKYYDSFAGRDEDIAFYLKMMKAHGEKSLELACGTGRIMIPALRQGNCVHGMDVSREMLDVAEVKFRDHLNLDERERSALIHADVRDFALGESYSLIYFPYNSFQHVLTVEDQKRALENIVAHLENDGIFVLDLFNPDLGYISDVICSREKGLVRSELTERQWLDENENGHKIATYTYVDNEKCCPELQQLSKIRVIEEYDTEMNLVTIREEEWRTRYTHRYELEHLLKLFGLSFVALYSDYRMSRFRADSKWMICLIQKKD